MQMREPRDKFLLSVEMGNSESRRRKILTKNGHNLSDDESLPSEKEEFFSSEDLLGGVDIKGEEILTNSNQIALMETFNRV